MIKLKIKLFYKQNFEYLCYEFSDSSEWFYFNRMSLADGLLKRGDENYYLYMLNLELASISKYKDL